MQSTCFYCGIFLSLWNRKVKGYSHSEEGQAKIYKDVINWGKNHGVIGIRYWAADYEDWGSMGLFKFENKHGKPKKAILDDWMI